MEIDLTASLSWDLRLKNCLGKQRRTALSTVFQMLRQAVGLTFLASICVSPSFALGNRLTDDDRTSYSGYGMTGMVEMPNALFQPDGTISFSGSVNYPNDRIAFGFQATPWFEGVFRYSIIKDFFPREDLFDRSFDFKLRLFEQKGLRPSFAIGMQDIVGTGVFAGEYMVATYETGNFNITSGIGFGRLGDRGTIKNPLTHLSSNFESRGNLGSFSNTGKFHVGRYFSGSRAAIFGGIEYLTPIEGLKVTVEYSGDNYRIERSHKLIDKDVPVNVGLSYRPFQWLEIGSSFINGKDFSFRMTIRANPKTSRPKRRLDPERIPYKIRQNPPVQASQSFDTSTPPGWKPVPFEPRSDNPALHQAYLWAPWQEVLPESFHTTAFEMGANPNQNPGQSPNVMETGKDAASWWNSQLTKSPVAKTSDHDSDATIGGYMQIAAVPQHIVNAAIIDAASDIVWTKDVPLLSDKQSMRFTRLLYHASSKQKLGVFGLSIDGVQANVFYSNNKYSRESEHIDRLLRALTQTAPDEIERFRLVATKRQLPTLEVITSRKTIERLAAQDASAEEFYQAMSFKPGSRTFNNSDFTVPLTFPRFGYGLEPSLRYSLFDPDDPARYQIAVKAMGNVELLKGLSLSGTYRLNIYNNFDEITRFSNSVLPKVRSDFNFYLSEGASGFDSLTLTYRRKLTKEIYTRVIGGYLEEMYGGVGGEILYRPYGKRWAVGVNAARVKKRNFNKLFGFRDYETTTAFLNIYYELPIYNLNLEVNAGRYLARDLGATINLTRRFDNGTEIGMFATFTDVPFERFGEGSFDKGLIIKIPFQTFTPFDSIQRYETIIRPLTRDGGAKVEMGYSLYRTTHQQSMGQINRTWNAIENEGGRW